MHAFLAILNNNLDPFFINNTHIVLIHKINNPKSTKDYRPASLCNLIFKLVTKTIANRLKHILPKIIHHTQSTFIPNRLITSNALVAFEIFHFSKNKRWGKTSCFTLKLDMTKAYDRVEWSFLEKMMEKMSFLAIWI